MSSSVMVNISGPKNQNDCLSRFQCTHPPKRPRTRKRAASTACRGWLVPYGSRHHCHLKYSHHMPTCAVNGALRSVTGGLPYCSRLKLYLKLSQVFWLNVQSTLSPVVQPVGSPSLISGWYAARIGCVANGVMPMTTAT